MERVRQCVAACCAVGLAALALVPVAGADDVRRGKITIDCKQTYGARVTCAGTWKIEGGLTKGSGKTSFETREDSRGSAELRGVLKTKQGQVEVKLSLLGSLLSRKCSFYTGGSVKGITGQITGFNGGPLKDASCVQVDRGLKAHLQMKVPFEVTKHT
jgi:hypothetical protein